MENLDLSKKTFWLGVALVAAIMFGGLGNLLSGYQAWTGHYQRTITVEATGTAYATPDIATVTVGVITEGDDAAAVTEENTEKMNKIIEAIKALGVEGDDIQTTSYYLSPKYRWDEDEGSQMDGFTLSQNIKVKIRDTEKASEVIAAATANNANNVSGLSFEVDDTENLKAEARMDAVEKAKKKAEGIEEATGLKLGKVVSMWEYSNDYYSDAYYSYDYGYGYGAGETKASSSYAAIETGQQEINLTVTLEYIVK